MTTRRRRPILLLVALGAAVVSALTAGGGPAVAAGATITETGWWSRSPGSATPPGGFQVARAVDGDLSVAAVRIAIEGRLTKALLVLKEAPGGFRSDAASINACPTASSWKAANPGALADAPKADCARKVALRRDATTSSWSGDVLPLLAGATAQTSLVLVPAAATGALPVDPGFTVEFSAAQLDAEGTDAAGPAGTDASSSPSDGSGSGTIASDTGGSGRPAASPAVTPSFAPTFSPVDSFAASPAPASVTPSPDVLPAATPEVAAGGAGGAGTAASVDAGLQPVAAPATRGEPPPWGRLAALLPLSIAAGAVVAAARRRLSGVAAA